MNKKIMFTAVLQALCLTSMSAQNHYQTKPSATLGPRDGISYYVSSSKTITKPSSDWCGYSDLLLPGWAKFIEETRVYEEYSKGKFIRSWVKKVDFFVECI